MTIDDDDLLDALLQRQPVEGGLDDIAKQTLLETVEEIGHVEDACADCRITANMLITAIQVDPTLNDDLHIALGRFRASMRRRVKHLALNGFEQPIIGGPKKNEVVAYATVPDAKALDVMSKMHFSKDMAQYTRNEIKTKDVTNEPRPDDLDVTKLSREDANKLVELLRTASGGGDAKTMKRIENHVTSKGRG